MRKKAPRGNRCKPIIREKWSGIVFMNDSYLAKGYSPASVELGFLTGRRFRSRKQAMRYINPERAKNKKEGLTNIVVDLMEKNLGRPLSRSELSVAKKIAHGSKNIFLDFMAKYNVPKEEALKLWDAYRGGKQ